MAAFADALDLRTAVVEAVGTASIVDVFPRLLAMAEDEINMESRHRRQITSTTLTFVDGEAAIPADFLEFVDAARDLDYRTAVDGDNFTILDFSGDREIFYFAKIPTITTNLTTTSWLLTYYPKVYLYAVAIEAAKHIRDKDMALAFAPLLSDAMRKMKADSDKARFAHAVVRVQGVTP